ncbi:sodium-dependent proline transporter-like [Styela clava]|uniref:sodium-dependent proline transporter-like n=1 Tax=Styela clava TaxID=7725 RepID=UPI0019395ADA|nr:sodium-dependent proline transporter-like [Styela clava]
MGNDDEDKVKKDAIGEERGHWDNHAEFLLSCIGYCVGLGNVWRFPYLAFENGGGAFLIPYVIMLALCGIPLFFLEMSLGQFTGLGPITAWKAVPIFKGIGYGMVLVSFFVIIYYNVIVAYAFYYLFASFTSVLPWTLCDQWWNKETFCNTTVEATTSSPAVTPTATTSPALRNRSTSISEEYWKYRVLRIDQSTGVGDPGPVLWDLCLCLLLSWIVVLLCLIKGIKSSGKVVYFTATFPYLILVILLIRGCTLEGAYDGIIFYVRPTWERLQDPKVWSTAAVQIFYSLGIAFGSLLAFSSYNKFNNNIVRDTLIVSIGNCATSIFAGFVIFSVLGHMAFKQRVMVEDVADTGPGLAFVAYPQAVALLPVPQLWSILFFFMLLTLGLDSQFGMTEAVLTGFIDEFPTLLRPHKAIFTTLVCVVCFLIGLIMVTPGGFYWFNLYNWYSAWYGLLFLALMFVLAIYWGYGFLFTYRWRLDKDIELMLGRKPMWYFRICWAFVTPVMLVFVIVMACLSYGPISLSGEVYPKWADDLGMCMSVTIAAVVPIYAVYAMIKAVVKGDSIKDLFKPDPSFCPADRTIAYDHLHGAVNDHKMTAYAVSPSSYQQKVDDSIPNAYPEL